MPDPALVNTARRHSLCGFRRAFLAGGLLAYLLSGCASTVIDDPEQHWQYVPAPGSTISLEYTLYIKSKTRRIRIQNGHVLDSLVELVRNEPYCDFWLTRSHSRVSTTAIVPGEFTVTKVYRRIDVVALFDHEFAVRPRVFGAVGNSWKDPQVLRTVMKLTSFNQPRVEELICEVESSALQSDHVTVAEIREVLGDLADTNLIPQKY